MKKPMLPVRLGQRVYVVIGNGVITTSFISRITLSEKKADSEFLAIFERMRNGQTHQLSDRGIGFGVLNEQVDTVYLDFDQALLVALNKSIDALCNADIGLRELLILQTRVQQYRKIPKEVKVELDTVESSIKSPAFTVLHRKEVANVAQADFPKKYYEVSREVWLVDIAKTRIIHGFVTQVEYYPREKGGEVLYRCGAHTGIKEQDLFGSLPAAKKALKERFEKTTPAATLDVRHVEVVEAESNDERSARTLSRFEKIAEQQSVKRPPGC